MTEYQDINRIGAVTLTNPMCEAFAGFIVANAEYCKAVVTQDTHKGKTVVICGAGPSLRAHVADFQHPDYDVWACNSALTWMLDSGYRVSHGFSIDQTEHMIQEWITAPDVTYYLASSVHPRMTQYLTEKGRNIIFFHNHVGLRPGELEHFLYGRFYPSSVKVGDGLNSVNRAACLAEYMGYAQIILLGADCALGVNDEMHANGDGPLASGATGMILEGAIDGRIWRTKPDMIISAVSLVRRQRGMEPEKWDASRPEGERWISPPERYQFYGDTLPNALKEKDDAFLDGLPKLTSAEEADDMMAARNAELAEKMKAEAAVV